MRTFKKFRFVCVAGNDFFSGSYSQRACFRDLMINS